MLSHVEDLLIAAEVKEEPFYFDIGLDDEDEEKKVQVEVETQVHKCAKCSNTFATLVEMAYHQNNVHAKKGEKHQCPSCTKTFANSTKLRIHIETVHEKKKVKCPLCDSIVLKHGLRNHMSVAHQGEL